jgi:SNF2 family DNA or RNA helicase
VAKGYYPLLHVGIPNGVELWTEDEAWRETPQGRRFGLLRDQIKAVSPQAAGSALLQQQLQKMTAVQKQADAKKRVAVLREELSQVQRELSTGLSRVRETFSAYHFFTNAIKVFTRDPAESECAICMEAGDVAPGGIAITSCGHIFCQDCIKANIAQACQCPYCRKPLPKAEPPHLYALQDQENTMQEMEAELEKAAPDEDVGADEDTGEEGAADDGTKQQSKKRNLDRLLLGGPDSNAEEQVPKYDQYGTKIRRICETLRQIKNDFPGKKAIVFCQWLELENKIADSFRTYGFRFSQLKGTAYQKNNIVTAFQNDEEVQDGDEWFPSPEILLMSLETAASGANLTKASHVLFVPLRFLHFLKL